MTLGQFSATTAILSLSLSLPLTPPVHAQNAPVGNATNAIGELVIVRTDGVQQRLQGKGNVPLYEGDVLKTDSSS
ncbi:MAG: hypothetical protein ABL960_04360, partial [Nitrospira sp.]